MATAAFPSVIRAIMSMAQTALADVRVVRGADNTNDPSDVVMVGVQDIRDLPGPTSAGSFSQVRQTFGGSREETGTVNCLVLARNGDGDQDLACSTALDYLAALETAVRADPTLGLTAYDYVVTDMESGDVTEEQNTDGAEAVLSFVIAYKIRI